MGDTSSPEDLWVHNEAKGVVGNKYCWGNRCAPSLEQPLDTKTIMLPCFSVRGAIKRFRGICGIQEKDDRNGSSLSSAPFALSRKEKKKKKKKTARVQCRSQWGAQ